MTQLLHSLLLLASVLTGAVANTIACAPATDTFSHHANDRLACTEGPRTPVSVLYDCGPEALIMYNFKENFAHLYATNEMSHGLTIHGSCTIRDRQVAHLDLHMDVPDARPYTEHNFHGLNRLCDVSLKHDTPKLTFWYYDMKPAEAAECFKHPITPTA